MTVKDPLGNHTVSYFAASRGRRNWTKANLTKVCSLASGSGCGQERHFIYDRRGFLTAERHPEVGSAGYANYIAYQPGGMLRRVPHGNISDWIYIGTDGLSRPYKIRTEGVIGGDWDSGAFIYDGAQNIESIGATRRCPKRCRSSWGNPQARKRFVL